jgi:uncharacterized protein (TIGR02001 family)
MKNKVLGSVLGAALLAGSTVAVADDAFAAENFSSTLTFTTDYTFRGTTFSNNDPAIQGSFDWGQGAWFAGVWASSLSDIDFTGGGGATMEVDYYFGWADNVGGVDLMVMPLWYTYPGQESGQAGARDDTTFELWTSAGIGFDNIPGAPYVTLSVNYSPEFFDLAGPGSADSALYTSLGVAFTLPQGFGIDFLYGKQDVSGGGAGSNDFFGDDYAHWNVGVTKSAAGFDFDVRYHDNEDVDDLNAYLAADFASDGDLVLSVSRSF